MLPSLIQVASLFFIIVHWFLYVHQPAKGASESSATGDTEHWGYYAWKDSEELAVRCHIFHLRRGWARPLSHPHRDGDGEVACRLGSSIIKLLP